MDIVHEQEILVIIYLFPAPNHDILIVSSEKADFTYLNVNFICRWSERYGCKLQEIMEAANC